ncbi:nicotinate (nicotinamide) nucleotide adenylyltransferase [Kwoniella sp. DSM 27419]
MAVNGFKSPAPVLPAMGLHSFHNDSPPFAGAATSEVGEPDYLPLDAFSRPLASPSEHDDSHLRPDHPHHAQSVIAPFPNAPINSIPSISRSASYDKSGRAHALPTPVGSQRSPLTMTVPIPGFSADEHWSSSRSRRLVSGYLFGNPPSPITSRNIPDDMGAAAAPAQVPQGKTQQRNGEISPRPSPTSEEEGDYPLPTPPLQDRDSPPLTEPYKSYSSPRLSGPGEGANALALDQTSESLGMVSLNDDGEVPRAMAPGQGSEPVIPPAKALSAKKSQSPSNGAGPGGPTNSQGAGTSSDTGYDALEGRNDGEADLDLSAPQAEGGGSGSYLRGEAEYEFPRHRLRKTMRDESKIPVVIVACGSFSPPTYLHLRMFEMAKDEVVESQTYEIMAGYYSPVSSYYKKAGLAPANHRVRMCELAVEHTSTWLMVDPWEAGQSEYQRTAVVLDHFDEMLNGGEDGEGGVIMSDGKKRRYKVMLLAGGDLIESFGEPGVWSEPDLHIILGRFGCLIVERAGSDVWAFLLSHDILYQHRRNVIVIKQLIYNDISSTKVRLFVRRGMSIKYLLPNSVIQYIYDNKLYRYTDRKA